MQQPFCKFITFLWGGGLLDMKDFKTFVYCQEIITILDLVCRKEVAGKNYFVCVCVCVCGWSTEINCFSEIPYGEVAFDLANI
jgi:hypothetical protein